MKKFFKINIILIISIFFVFYNFSLFAQKDSILEFFPLHTGDLHQFHYHYSYENCNGNGEEEYSSYNEEKVLGVHYIAITTMDQPDGTGEYTIWDHEYDFLNTKINLRPKYDNQSITHDQSYFRFLILY